MIINCVINTDDDQRRSNVNGFCLPTNSNAVTTAAAAAFPFGCILNPIIKNQFLDSHISFGQQWKSHTARWDWIEPEQKREKGRVVCSTKNHGLIGWGVFCNFKLPHICYRTVRIGLPNVCYLIYHHSDFPRGCLFSIGRRSAWHSNTAQQPKPGLQQQKKQNKKGARKQYLLINVNL